MQSKTTKIQKVKIWVASPHLKGNIYMIDWDIYDVNTNEFPKFSFII